MSYIIEDKQLRYKKVAGELNYRKLMANSQSKPSEAIIEAYEEFNKKKRFYINKNDKNTGCYFNLEFRNFMKTIHKSESYIVDVLVRYLYEKESRSKETLWNMYGDIIFANIEKNLNGTISCETCPKRFKQTTNAQKFCKECAKKSHDINVKEAKKRYYNKISIK